MPGRLLLLACCLAALSAGAKGGAWDALRSAADQVRVFEGEAARSALLTLARSDDKDVAAAAAHMLARLDASAGRAVSARMFLDASMPTIRAVAEPAARFAEVEVLAAEGRPNDAFEQLSALRSKFPDFRAAQAGLLATRLAEAAELGNRGAAVSLEVLSMSRIRLPADELLARAARLTRREDEAQRLRERLITGWPESPLADEALQALGTSLTRSQKLERVRRLFQNRAYERCRDEALALWNLGVRRDEVGFILGKIGSERLRDDPHGALRFFGPATAVGAPNARDALDSLAVALAKTGQTNASLQTFDLWLARYGDEPVPDDALKRFREEVVREAAPVREVLETVYDKSRLLHALGRSAEAARTLDAFLRRNPEGYDRGKYQWFVAFWQLQAGNYRQARPLLARLAAGKNPLVGGKGRYWLGWSEAKQGRPDEAAAEWARLATEMPLTYYAALAQQRLGPRAIARTLPKMPKDTAPVWPSTLGPAARRVRLAAHLAEPDTARYVYDKSRAALGTELGRSVLADLDQALAEPLERYAERRSEARRRYSKALKTGPTDETLAAWRAVYPRAYKTHVQHVAKEHGVPEWMVYAHMLQESRFKPWMISGAPAFGLLELLDRTARRLASERGDEYQRWMLLEPRWNIRWAGQYLGALIRKFDGKLPLAVASYNGGPRLISVLLDRTPPGTDFDVWVEDIPTHESRNYLRKVIEHMLRYSAIWGGEDALGALSQGLFPKAWRGHVNLEPDY